MTDIALFIEVFALLLIWHALADYPLQGDFLARAKNRFAPIPGVPWQWPLASHAAIHAGGVWVITDNGWLALLQFASHALIDDLKCEAGKRYEGRRMATFAFHCDQIAHVAVMAVIAAWVVAL